MRHSRSLALGYCLLLAALLQLSATNAALAVTKTWDAGGDGVNWNSFGNWNPDGVPTLADDVLLDHTSVATAYTVTLNISNALCKSLTIGAGGNVITFSLPFAIGADNSLFIDAAASTQETLVVNNAGRLEIQGNANGDFTARTINNASPNNRTRFKNGSYLLMNSATSYGNTFPAAAGGSVAGGTTFEPTSTVEVTSSAGGLNFQLDKYNYGNLTFTAGIATDFQPNAVTNGSITIEGTITVGANARFFLLSDSPDTITVKGNVSLGGGSSLFVQGTGGTLFDGSPTTVFGSGVIGAPSGGTVWSVNAGKELRISTGAQAYCNSPLQGAGAFTLLDNATIRTELTTGINGAVTVSGTKTFSQNATYWFQNFPSPLGNTGTNMPSQIKNLIVEYANNPSGTLALSKATTITGTLTMTAGRLHTNDFPLILSNAAPGALVWTSGKIQGLNFSRAIDPTIPGVRYFPMAGPTGQIAYVSLTIAGGTTPGSVSVSTTNFDHPQTRNAAKSLNRFWTITKTGLGNLVANFEFTYNDAEVSGTEANYVVSRFNGVAWDPKTTALDTTLNTATVNGISEFSDWTLGEPGAVSEKNGAQRDSWAGYR